jgi:hypothetical protein
MIGYVYNIGTNNVHAILTSDDQSKIETAAETLCDEEYALTYTLARGANDGLEICADTNEYDLDDANLNWVDISL